VFTQDQERSNGVGKRECKDCTRGLVANMQIVLLGTADKWAGRLLWSLENGPVSQTP
jgi:hypothetical protein